MSLLLRRGLHGGGVTPTHSVVCNLHRALLFLFISLRFRDSDSFPDLRPATGSITKEIIGIERFYSGFCSFLNDVRAWSPY